MVMAPGTDKEDGMPPGGYDQASIAFLLGRIPHYLAQLVCKVYLGHPEGSAMSRVSADPVWEDARCLQTT